MKFDTVREKLEGQFQNVQWIKGSGLDKDALMAQLDTLEQQYSSATMIRANAFALIAEKARIAIDKEDIFQDKIDGYNLIKKLRIRWEKALKAARLPREAEEVTKAWSVYGTYHATSDYSHTSPNTRLLMEVGFEGLRDRVQAAMIRDDLTEKQKLGKCFLSALDVTVDSCGDDLGIVDDEHIARVYVIEDIVEVLMLYGVFSSVEQHETAMVPLLCGVLCDKLLRQIVVKICGEQIGGFFLVDNDLVFCVHIISIAKIIGRRSGDAKFRIYSIIDSYT